MTKCNTLLLFSGFLGLSLIAAHVINWFGGGVYGLYAYPAGWLLALLTFVLPSTFHKADGSTADKTSSSQ